MARAAILSLRGEHLQARKNLTPLLCLHQVPIAISNIPKGLRKEGGEDGGSIRLILDKLV